MSSFDIKVSNTKPPRFVTVYPPHIPRPGLGWEPRPHWTTTKYYHFEESWSPLHEQILTKADQL